MKRHSSLLAGALAVVSLASAANAADCTVHGIEGGAASVWRGGSATPLSQGMPLSSHDRIETGADTRVDIRCAEGLRMTLGPQTSLDLGSATGDGQSWSTFLMEGVSWFARPLFGEDRFEVRTPSAVASVRSTEWFVEVTAGATAVFVDEGRVAVLAREGGAVLGAEQGIDVSAESVAGPVKTWGAARVRALRTRLGFVAE